MPELPPKLPTLREIARESGFALSTVSAALRGLPGVAESTVSEVRAVAESMGWRPNPLVSAWLSHVRATHAPQQEAALAYIISSPLGMQRYLQSPVFRAYLEGARMRAGQLGFSFESFHYEAFGSKRLDQILQARGIAGVLIAPLAMETTEAIELEWAHYTACTIGYSFTDSPMHRAVNHHFHSSYLAVKQLEALGNRRIGLALPQAIDLRSTGMFSGGYLSACRLSDLASLTIFNEVAGEEVFAAFGKWMQSERPDAVIGLSDLPVRMEGHGYGIPRDVAFANIDLRPEHTGQAGIDQQSERIGVTAVDLVTAQLFRNERGVPTHPKLSLVESLWRPGPSAPKRRRKRA